MRLFFTTTVARADSILQDGFTDVYEEGGISGVWFADRPLDANDGFDGDVVLCLELPTEEFTLHEWVEDGGWPGYGYGLVPPATLNRFGPPQIYDHTFAGSSRRELVQAIRAFEQADPPARAHAQEMRKAMEFFDRIGWLTPLRLREESAGGSV
jgi:hypothetical protein